MAHRMVSQAGNQCLMHKSLIIERGDSAELVSSLIHNQKPRVEQVETIIS